MEWIHYGRYLHERAKGKPTQYITGRQEFYGHDFRVTPDVLIPRPETELLVEVVLNELPPASRIIDIGTGSGAIAITLAREGKHIVTATDISAKALDVARTNGTAITVVQSDLLTAIADNAADAVVSNPPYIPISDTPTLQREVRDHEPHLALFGGETGLDIYEKLIPEAQRVLRSGGLLALELGFGQSEAVAALTASWTNLKIHPDLAGIPRVLTCRKPLHSPTG